MADPRFFKRAGPFRLRELAAAANAELSQGADPERLIHDVAPLDSANGEQVSFLDNKRYLPKLGGSGAGACLLEPAYVERAPPGMALLVTRKPYRGYALVTQLFYPRPRVAAGIHPTAVVHAEARIADSAAVAAYAVVEAGAEIGERCSIGAHSVVGAGVVIGEDTVIGTHVSLEYCLIGRGCQIHAGARIGARGFGFTLDPEGFLDVPQVGRVVIGNGVEIGANSTVDRGAAPDTVIGDGTRIDNLVQLGHNVQVGRNCILIAQSGVAGSTKLMDYVTLAAQAGIAGHLTLEKGAKVAAKSGVMRDVQAGETVGGIPAMPLRDFFRLVVSWQRQLQEKSDRDE